jgi:F-type H+-transporting ATPase subunit alpha
VVREFQGNFEASDGSSVVPKEKQEEALDEDEDEVDQETVKVNKPAPAKD